jgi:alkaline phosphatase
MEIDCMTRITKVLILVALLIASALGAGLAIPLPAGGPYPDLVSGREAEDLDFYRPPATTAPYPLTGGKQPRNVILLIGDGMGANQVAVARMKAAGVDGKLHMERMPVAGLVRTHSADDLVTDSAASGTALATGVKTKNGMIGMAPDEQAHATILELARDKGMATGLIATSSITHATPASFASHVKSRKMETRIAEHLIASRVNVLFGGGRQFFLPKSHGDSVRKDDQNLIAEAKEAGYAYVEDADALRSVSSRHLLGLFAVEELTTEPPEPSLAQLASKAISVLRRIRPDSKDGRNGFFLMVEGSQIDWACHDNDLKNAVRQTLLFDQAVAAAIDFALRDGRTLVIVTADHETGGLTFTGSKKGTPAVHWATKGHTGAPVPIYALGPGAETFAGVYDNTEIPRRLAQLLRIRPFPQARK